MLAAMAASLAATACCTSGLRRMMSSQAGTSSSVRFRLVQPRLYSDACSWAMGFHWGDPETTALKSLSIARFKKTLFISGLNYCEGPQ